MKGYNNFYYQKHVQKSLLVPKFHGEEHSNVKLAIEKRIAKSAVEKCESTKTQFISTYFLAKKSDDSYRFNLNPNKLFDQNGSL